MLRGSLAAGTSYVKVTAGNASETGPYTIVAYEDTEYASFIDGCSAISTDYDDPLYGCQWHLNNTGRNGGTAGEDINVEEVWAEGNLGAGINVAVVDNGLYYEHEDLRDNVDRGRNYDYTFRATYSSGTSTTARGWPALSPPATTAWEGGAWLPGRRSTDTTLFAFRPLPTWWTR